LLLHKVYFENLSLAPAFPGAVRKFLVLKRGERKEIFRMLSTVQGVSYEMVVKVSFIFLLRNIPLLLPEFLRYCCIISQTWKDGLNKLVIRFHPTIPVLHSTLA
jgi:hypothetical protein